MRNSTSKRSLAKRLANEISLINWLSKNACNSKSKSAAYSLKAQKFSFALVEYGNYFPIRRVEEHDSLGVLLLVNLPNQCQAHIPFNHLSKEAKAKVLHVIYKTTLQIPRIYNPVCA